MKRIFRNRVVCHAGLIGQHGSSISLVWKMHENFRFNGACGSDGLFHEPCASTGTPPWRFSAYGTLGAVATDTDRVQYRASVRQSHGADKTVDFGVDSRIGAQVDYRLNSVLSAVG